jgi:hypothetical protein
MHAPQNRRARRGRGSLVRKEGFSSDGDGLASAHAIV